MPVPAAERFATVGLLTAQKFWGDEPVGGVGLFTVTTTATRATDSHPPIVWLA